jgi:hypothetical protein
VVFGGAAVNTAYIHPFLTLSRIDLPTDSHSRLRIPFSSLLIHQNHLFLSTRVLSRKHSRSSPTQILRLDFTLVVYLISGGSNSFLFTPRHLRCPNIPLTLRQILHSPPIYFHIHDFPPVHYLILASKHPSCQHLPTLRSPPSSPPVCQGDKAQIA